MSLSAATVTAAAISIQMVLVTGGEYRPLYMKSDSELISVADFMIDVMPVTNQAFYHFSEQESRWQKQSIPSLFAENNYERIFPFETPDLSSYLKKKSESYT